MSDVTMRSQVEVPAPFSAADLARFVDQTPDKARVTVIVREGGTQRDPYPTAYVFIAQWEVPDA